EGDSIRRQIELTSAWAKKSKVHLDTSLAPDRGISAFRGKNHDIGALGEFLRFVEKGRAARFVPRGRVPRPVDARGDSASDVAHTSVAPEGRACGAAQAR